MSNPQKKLILWTLTGLAVLVHVLFCEWELFNLKRPKAKVTSIAHFWEGYYGNSDLELYAHGESSLLGIALGIMLPLLLLVARIYLQLGWFGTVFVASRIKKAFDVLNSMPGMSDNPRGRSSPTKTNMPD